MKKERQFYLNMNIEGWFFPSRCKIMIDAVIIKNGVKTNLSEILLNFQNGRHFAKCDLFCDLVT